MIAPYGIACLLLTSAAAAGPYLVEFEGTITEIAVGAPDTFWIGERVAGAFVYNPEAPIAIKIHHRFTLVDLPPSNASPPAGWPDVYGGFPNEEASDFLTQVWRGGSLSLATEGGFSSHDEALDILWIGSSNSDRAVTFAESGAPVFFGGNSGYWFNKVLGEPAIPLTLETISGPQATALQINFGPADPEFVVDDQGIPEATLTGLADPVRFRPIFGGIQFGPPDFSFASNSTDVTFQVDTFTIVATPEPGAAAYLALLLGMVSSSLSRNRRRILKV